MRKTLACTQAPSASQAQEISDELLSSFYAGELDRIELLYTSFISMIASMPTVRTLIPLLPSGMEMEGDEIFKMTTVDGSLSIQKEKLAPASPEFPVPSLYLPCTFPVPSLYIGRRALCSL